jgi:hypothetical protein
MDKQPTRRYQLCVDRIETLEDVKKILDMMQIRINTDNPLYEEVKDYFGLEVVPRGYIKLLEKVGYEGIRDMNWDEMEAEASKLLNEENEETN